MARQYGLPAVNDLDSLEVPPEVLALVPREHCLSHCVLPLARHGAHPPDGDGRPDERLRGGPDPVQDRPPGEAAGRGGERHHPRRAAPLRRGEGARAGRRRKRARGRPRRPPLEELDPADIALDGVEIDPDAFGADEAEVEQVQVGPEEIDLASLTHGSADRPVVGLVNRILVEAYRRGASDIHVEPYEKEFAVRFRIDGVLVEYGNLPPRVRETVTTRIKIMANLDIAERRLPQGGRIKIRMRQDDRARDLDFRVSCLPTLWGEKIVLRLLDKAKLMLDMTKLGFEVGVAAPLPGRDRPALRHRARHRPHRVGQDEHPLLGALHAQQARHQHHDRRGPRRVQPARHQPGADPRGGGPHLRDGAAGVPAPGPEHHPGRRDPRLRDGRDRGEGRAHRPPRPLDPPHERRPVHGLAPRQHGHRALPGGHRGEPHPGAAAGEAPLRPLQDRRHEGPPLRRTSWRPASRPQELAVAPGPPRPRLPGLQRHRLQGPGGALRGDGDDRGASATS